MLITSSTEQKNIVELLKDNNVTVDSVAGSGKCHAINTPIIMFNGSIKLVQDIQVGEQLMGEDSKARTVLSLGRGQDTMYEIVPTKGESFICNSEHILSLKYSLHKNIFIESKNKWYVRYFNNSNLELNCKWFDSEKEGDEFIKYNQLPCDISIKNYLKLSSRLQKELKLYRTGVNFPAVEVPFDPYIIGLWIGDGSSNETGIPSQDSVILHYLNHTLPKYDYSNEFLNVLKHFNLINNKHIPDVYKINSRQIRLELLAGIIDTDGHLRKNGCYEFSQKNERIMDDVIYLARSLGFAAYKSIKKYGTAFKTTISGNIEEIPVKIERKKAQFRQQIKNTLITGFKVIKKTIDNYYGFTIDGNHRYLLGDFTVTHNTTTILFIAEKYPDLNILVLTYNAQLKTETRKRAEKFMNLSVHSYHSFCVSNYDKSAYTDDKINDLICNNSEPCCDLYYDIIIADESQDITPLLYRLLCKILTDNQKRKICKIMIMGDQMQSIYKFKESDCRFITFSDQIFNKFNDFKWVKCTLSETFRCTIPIVNFINECMIGYKRLISNKTFKFKPDYVICNSYSYPSTIINEYLKIYKPQDIFVIAYSTKDKTPIKHLANYVTNNLNIPIYCSGSDQELLDSRVIENKLVFSTIHQTKGRERKAVLFIGFDESYFEYYDKVANQKICPNELYVVATRASERLTLVHDSKKNYLPFLDHTNLVKYTNFSHKQTKENPIKRNIPEINDTYTVSDLISYLPFSIENLCMNYLTVKTIREADSVLYIPSIIKMVSETGEIYESVSDITGVAIPAQFEYIKLGRSSLFSKNLVERNIYRIENGNYETKIKISMITKLKKFSKTLKEFHKNHIENMDINKLSVSDLLKISLYYSAQQNKTDYKLKQITIFDWLTKETLKEGTDRLSEIVKGKNLLFEESIEGSFFGNTVIGEIDCIDLDNNIVYEFKCTKDLSVSHIIQLCIYMCIHNKNYRYILFNIFTNETKEIFCSIENLQKIIKILIEHKISGKTIKTDSDFLKDFVN
jgi:hypothetical protein